MLGLPWEDTMPVSATACARFFQRATDGLIRDGLDHLDRHQPVGQQLHGPALPPLRRATAGQSDEESFLLPIEFALAPGPRAFASCRVQTFFDTAFANPLDGGNADMERRSNGLV